MSIDCVVTPGDCERVWKFTEGIFGNNLYGAGSGEGQRPSPAYKMHTLNLKHAVTDRVRSGEGLCPSPAYTYIAELTVVIFSDITAVRRTDPSTILCLNTIS